LLVLPMFALITVFLEFLGCLHIFANFGRILSVGGLRKGAVPVFIRFQIASGDRSCLVLSKFSNQAGLFVMSCSLAALLQTTRMCMPQLLLAGVVFGVTGRGVACSALLSLGYFQDRMQSSSCQCRFCERRWCCFSSSLGAAGR